MKINDFTSMVHCLSCGESNLEVSKASTELICKTCNQKYPIQNGVPVFISLEDYKKESEPDFHKNQGTTFKYVDHYQKDGVEHDYFKTRDAGTEHGDRRVHEYIFSNINKAEGKILDVGCGRAWVAEGLCPKNYEVVSMDISIDNTTKALKTYPYENHSAIVADVFELPFNENVFDYIIASEIIEHVVDPAKFVKNLFQILKPGGSLIITTPYKETIKYTLCVHCNKLTPLHAHLHSFDEKILTSLYKDEKLKSCEYYTFGNKIPIHLRMHSFMKYLNFAWWKRMDHFLNLFYNAPFRILVKWEKTNN
jgi:2-polyprenyl-3-methyl-5-hydroxy-6-metoxy-1,4-benzoquinol methylase/uncharacterized protein YbaR (Trm112 family)